MQREEYIWKRIGDRWGEKLRKNASWSFLGPEKIHFKQYMELIKNAGVGKYALNIFQWYVGSKKHPKSMRYWEDWAKAIEPLKL